MLCWLRSQKSLKKLFAFDRMCQTSCYNAHKNMKSAIRNPKSEMEGPYLSNAYAKVEILLDSVENE